MLGEVGREALSAGGVEFRHASDSNGNVHKTATHRLPF